MNSGEFPIQMCSDSTIFLTGSFFFTRWRGSELLATAGTVNLLLGVGDFLSCVRFARSMAGRWSKIMRVSLDTAWLMPN